jgi:exosortase A
MSSPSINIVAAVLAACCAVLAIFSADVAAALSTWARSSAYSYCYLILPVSLYLIYSRRAELRRIEPVPSSLGGAMFAGCFGLWWIGSAASVTELRQFAVVGMLHAIVLCMLGRRFYRAVLFPMLYLFLMVPTATFLLGPLQTLTTVLSADLLRAASIPVLGENHLIEVPHGLYEVAPGCAGLNFLLSTAALSSIYALLVFESLWKRFASVAAMLLLSMFVNAVRVFGIIWLAEATNRRIDIVDDHLVYGWGVYCVFILAVMLFGVRFRDAPALPAVIPGEDAGIRPRLSIMWFGAFVIAIVAWAIHTALAGMNPAFVDEPRVQIELPARIGEWLRTNSDAAFSPPALLHADGLSRVAYAKGARRTEILIAYYWRQRQGSKISDIIGALADGGNSVVENQTQESVPAGAPSQQVETLQTTQGKSHRLIWTYDWVGGRRTTNALFARLLGMGAAMGADGRSAMIIVSADDGDGEGRETLTDFFKDAPMIDRALASASLRSN